MDDIIEQLLLDIKEDERTWRETVQVGDWVDCSTDGHYTFSDHQYKTEGKLYQVRELDFRHDVDGNYYSTTVIVDGDYFDPSRNGLPENVWLGPSKVIIREGKTIWESSLEKAMRHSMLITSNPMGFHCAPNQATPDYVCYENFRSWVAYGLMTCWLGTKQDDPNSDLNMPRSVTREDVQELRGHFLDVLETVIVMLWKGQHKPGDGDLESDGNSLTIAKEGEDDSGEAVNVDWYVRLTDKAIMFEMNCTGADGITIWLDYKAIEDKNEVLKVLKEARQYTSDKEVWPQLVALIFDTENTKKLGKKGKILTDISGRKQE